MYGQKDIGIQLYSLRNQLDQNADRALKLIDHWGLKYIKGADSCGLPEEDFRKLIKKNNLKAVSIGASYPELRNDPQSVLEKAKRYKVKFVMCAWIPHPGDTFDINITQTAMGTFNKAGALLKKEGITLTYHAHGYELRPHECGTLF